MGGGFPTMVCLPCVVSLFSFVALFGISPCLERGVMEEAFPFSALVSLDVFNLVIPQAFGDRGGASLEHVEAHLFPRGEHFSC